MPNWDHSPRLGYNGTIFHKSTPTLWGKGGKLFNTYPRILIRNKKPVKI